jgi:hypothetical protein
VVGCGLLATRVMGEMRRLISAPGEYQPGRYAPSPARVSLLTRESTEYAATKQPHVTTTVATAAAAGDTRRSTVPVPPPPPDVWV